MPVYDDQKTSTRADDDELRRITGIDPAEEKKMEENAIHDGSTSAASEASDVKKLEKDNKKPKTETTDEADKDLFTGKGKKSISLKGRLLNRKSGILLGVSGGVIGVVFALFVSLPNILITTLRDLLVSRLSSIQTSQQLRYRRTKLARVSDAFSREGRMGSRIIAEMEADGYRFTFGDAADRNRITGITLPGGRQSIPNIGDALGAHINDYMEVRHPLRTARWKTKRMEAFYGRYKVSRVSVVTNAVLEVADDPQRAVNKAIANEVLDPDASWDDSLRVGAADSETEQQAADRNTRQAAVDALNEDLDDFEGIADELKANGTPLADLDISDELRESITEIDTGAGPNVLQYAERAAQGSVGSRIWGGFRSLANPTEILDKICTVKRRLRNGQTAARSTRALALMKYAFVFIAAGDSVRRGDARSQLISEVMGRTTKLDSYGNPIGASPGFAYALKGTFSKTRNDAHKAGYALDGKTTGVWKGVQDATDIPGTSLGQCSVIQNVVFQVVTGVVSAVVGFFTGGGSAAITQGTVAGVRLAIREVIQDAISNIFTRAFIRRTVTSLAITAAIEISFEGIMQLVQMYVEKSMKLSATGQEVGGTLGNFITAGAGTANKQRSLQAGFVPATAEQYAQAETDYIAWKKEEMSKQSLYARLFDTSNTDSLAFQYTAQFALAAPMTTEALGQRAQLAASSIADALTLKPLFGAMSRLVGGKAYAQTDDEISFDTYTTEGDNAGVDLAVDYAGNLLPVLRQDITAIDPQENIGVLVASGDIDATTLEPSSSAFTNHIINCVEALDIISQIEFENNPDDPAKDCLAQNPLTVRFKAHLAYLDMVDGLEAEFLPDDIANGTFDAGAGQAGQGNTGQTIANFTGPVIPCQGQTRAIQRIGDRASWDGITPTGSIGRNSANQDINVFVRDACAGQTNVRTVVIGASIHGSENGGQVIAQDLLFNKQLPPDVRIIAIPEINKAGLTGQSPAPRFNANGVNLNRNFDYRWESATASSVDTTPNYKGTSAASEPETQAIQAFLTNLGRSSLVISYHDNINWVAPSGPNSSVSRPMAVRYAALANHPLLNNNQGFGFFESWYAATTGTPALLVELSSDSSAPYLTRHADALVGIIEEGLVQ